MYYSKLPQSCKIQLAFWHWKTVWARLEMFQYSSSHTFIVLWWSHRVQILTKIFLVWTPIFLRLAKAAMLFFILAIHPSSSQQCPLCKFSVSAIYSIPCVRNTKTGQMCSTLICPLGFSLCKLFLPATCHSCVQSQAIWTTTISYSLMKPGSNICFTALMSVLIYLFLQNSTLLQHKQPNNPISPI